MSSVSIGIHDHPDFKLGLSASDPLRQVLDVEDILKDVELPEIPPTVDYFGNTEFGLYTNDRFGICGPTSVCNYRRTITTKIVGRMIAPTQADCDQLYRDSGNPHFNPNLPPDDPRQDDKGVNMKVMLNALVKKGVGGIRAMAYFAVNAKNIKLLETCDAIFGGVLFGVTLKKAQQSQTDRGIWDYVPNSGAWGGHAIYSGKFMQDKMHVITWKKDVEMTPLFVQHQSDEAYIVIFPEHFSNKTFMDNIDFDKLANSYKSITGKNFPDWRLEPSALNLG